QFQAPVETLDRSNWREVPTDLRLWLESKGKFYVCLDEKDSYYSSGKNDARVPTDVEILTSTVAALRLNKTGEVDTQPNFKNHSIVLSHERSIKWDKDASAVIFWLRQCCSYDHDIIEEQGTPKKAWDALNMKYSKVKAGDLQR
ncbi:hypothetical protein OnM2_035101, partial [Erysiphe neolycopersici]